MEVTIVTFVRTSATNEKSGSTGKAPNAFVAAAREQGVNIHVIEERFRFDTRVIGELRRIVAEESPDILQTHMVKSHFLVKLAELHKQYPWIAYHHGYTTTNLKMRGYNRLNRWSLPSAARVITVCQAFADQLTQAGVRANRLRVCHNSVVAPRKLTSDEQQELKNRFKINRDERVMLSVGRLSREKGHADLISAVAHLRDFDPLLKFKLMLVGEGPEQEHLEQAVHKYDLKERVCFVGHVSDVAPFYSIADVLVLPSHSEGSPNVLLEAMAAGIPIVATSVGGVPEITVAEEHALLVSPHEPQALARSLHRLLKTPDLANNLGASAQARVEKNFSPQAYVHSLIETYRELLEETQRTASESVTPKLALTPGATKSGSNVRVSIIVPLFNKAPHVKRALDSILAQTCADFELIVVDDGSTDDGPRIVEDYDDARIRLVRQSNFGPGAARNRGLNEAQGELVAFLDADDEWLPDYLAESVRLMDASGPGVAAVVSGYIECPAGVSREQMWRARGLTDGVVRVTPETSPRLLIALLAYMSPCTTVARAEAVRQWGGFFEQDHCRYGEDANLWLKVLLNEGVAVNLRPMTRIHFEASGAAQTRRSLRPVEPFLIDAKEIEAATPPDLVELRSQVLAIRALKTACVLGYWGRWREARDLVKRFSVHGAWRLPYYVPSLVCRTPIGPAMGKLSRILPLTSSVR
jgi:glycosyltransferase involved in cell wall biosynthesis